MGIWSLTKASLKSPSSEPQAYDHSGVKEGPGKALYPGTTLVGSFNNCVMRPRAHGTPFRDMKGVFIFRGGHVSSGNSDSPPFCHPERSRGICSSADLSWKCRILFHHEFVISPARACRGTGACRSGDICGPLFPEITRTQQMEHTPPRTAHPTRHPGKAIAAC
jgi:hypothetical protein